MKFRRYGFMTSTYKNIVITSVSINCVQLHDVFPVYQGGIRSTLIVKVRCISDILIICGLIVGIGSFIYYIFYHYSVIFVFT
jgi:hypothetical protein